jgi:hypothetical protein
VTAPRQSNGRDCGCAAVGVYASRKERQCQANKSELRFSHSPFEALEFLAVGGHREEEFGKTRCLQTPQPAQAFVFHHHTAGLPCLVTVCRSCRAASTTSLNRFLASCTLTSAQIRAGRTLLGVQLGLVIEHFNRERYERNSGQAVKEVQRRIGYPVTDVKGARSLLAWSQEQLSAAADVSIPTPLGRLRRDRDQNTFGFGNCRRGVHRRKRRRSRGTATQAACEERMTGPRSVRPR